MIRQTLDPDAPLRYTATDLTSLQYREAAGDVTKEVRSDLKAPVRIRIERHANQFTMAAGNPAEELKRFGPVTINLQDPVYVGLAVGSHNADALETAVFSNVTVQQSADQKPAPIKTSHISVYDLRSKSVNLLFSADQMIEAPTYSPDGKFTSMLFLPTASGSLSSQSVITTLTFPAAGWRRRPTATNCESRLR